MCDIEHTIMFKFPDKSLFSKIQPSRISIRWPSLAATVATGGQWQSRINRKSARRLRFREVWRCGRNTHLSLQSNDPTRWSWGPSWTSSGIVESSWGGLRVWRECSRTSNDELTMLQRIDVALDKEEIGTWFYGEKARTRDGNSVCIPEVLGGCSCGGFELRSRLVIAILSVRRRDRTWMTAWPSSVVLGLMMISNSMPPVSITRFRADEDKLDG